MFSEKRRQQDHLEASLAQAAFEGEQRGMEIGALVKTKELVLNMFNKGFDSSTIALATNLTEKEIQELISSH